jgi:hypothetical protein
MWSHASVVVADHVRRLVASIAAELRVGAT